MSLYSKTDEYVVNAAAFRRQVLRWFDRHGRKNLPWQAAADTARDPYRIWVAEIMLQQTRVTAVIPYYQKFIARFPNISALARADADAVLQHWAGLGYYARARNLHKTAQMIRREHGGKFPDEFAQVVALPGIGRSTAGAILAFAFAQRWPILDANVRRVLTRYFACEGARGDRELETELWRRATELTPAKRIGDYTQAMMDIGATLCLPARPQCARCPLRNTCRAQHSGAPTAYPRPQKRAPRPRKSVAMFIITDRRGACLLIKRPPHGIWGGLWSLPEIAAAAPAQLRQQFAQQYGMHIEVGDALPAVRHAFTHFELDIHPRRARLTAALATDALQIRDTDAYIWYDIRNPPAIGLPAVVQRILQNL